MAVDTTPRSSSASRRRMARRAGGRPTLNIERPPIVLEIGPSVIRAGYAGQCLPQHVIAVTAALPTTSSSATLWHAVLAPLIDVVFDRLHVKPSSRRVVCVHAAKHPPRLLTATIQRILWHLGVPAVSCVSGIDVLPTAQPAPRGMVVHVVPSVDAACVAHTSGSTLGFTYQSVPCDVHFGKVIDREECQRTERACLDTNNANSLVLAVLRCLEATPRDVRMDVAANIIVTGDLPVLLPDLGRKLVVRVKEILESGEFSENSSADPEEEQPEIQPQFAMVPSQLKALQPLSSKLGLLSCEPCRPDMLAWMGASLWADTWYKYDDEETNIPWAFPPGHVSE